jgi:hypothetical protein
MDRANVRVVQEDVALALPLQTAGGLPVVGGFVGKELQSDVSTDLQGFRHTHHPGRRFPTLRVRAERYRQR